MPRADPQEAALAALHAGRLEEAERLYRDLLATLPHPAFLNNLALVLSAQRRDAEAIALFERAIAARPADTGARVGLANALIQCGRAEEALVCCDELLGMQPANRDARHNRVVALRALARNQEAAEGVAQLLADDPADADAEFNLALAELMLGRYESAWRHYEARWRGAQAQAPLPDCGVPLWRAGGSLARRAVLVQAEQGLGDVIQFLRFVPALASVAARVELHLPAPLVAMARRSFVGIEVDTIGATPRTRFDCRLGLLSLPFALGVGDPGGAPAYLRADPERLAAWDAKLPAGRRLAFAWRGNPASRHDPRRSMPVEALEPWLAEATRRGFALVAVQRDLDARERTFLSRYAHIAAPGEALADFDDTAACMALAEHVACVDTSVVHLAGALGRSSTVMLQFASDWRWGIDRPAGSTYRSVRTLRQPRPGDWTSVVRALTESLP